MAATFGQFGEVQAKLTSNEFFNWFQLQPTGEAAGPGEHVFRPEGPAFREWVTLVSRADSSGRLEGLTLNVARDFIEDPRQGAFARDLVKSFLEAVGGGAPELTSLINEIFHRDPRGPVLMAGQRPPLPPEPSPGYLAFKGARPAWVAELSRLSLTFANLTIADDAWLAVQAERLADAPSKGWLSRLLGR